MNCSAVPLESIERLRIGADLPVLVPTVIDSTILYETSVSVQPSYSDTAIADGHPVIVKCQGDPVKIVGFVLAALFLVIIIALIMAIKFYFMPKKRKSNVKNKNVPACMETNAFESDVNKHEYEDITCDHSRPSFCPVAHCY